MDYFAFCRLSLAICFCVLVGCGEKRELPDRFVVSGSVTLDGEPLKEGSISFESSDDVASGLVASGDIIDGRYSAKVTPGQKSVKINWVVQGGAEEFQEMIPPNYNTNTTLQANVSADSKEFDFPLTSKFER